MTATRAPLRALAMALLLALASGCLAARDAPASLGEAQPDEPLPQGSDGGAPPAEAAEGALPNGTWAQAASKDVALALAAGAAFLTGFWEGDSTGILKFNVSANATRLDVFANVSTLADSGVTTGRVAFFLGGPAGKGGASGTHVELAAIGHRADTDLGDAHLALVDPPAGEWRVWLWPKGVVGTHVAQQVTVAVVVAGAGPPPAEPLEIRDATPFG